MRRSTLAFVCAFAVFLMNAAPLGSVPRDWPPFLRASDEYPSNIAQAVGRLWVYPTFTRTVIGAPAPVPLAFYLKFVDTPDVAAALARHLGLTTYDVKVLGGDWYAASDGNRTHGVYHVLARDGARRVIVSWGTHRSPIVGTIDGSALTRLELNDEGGGATQRLVLNVIVDNGLAAGLTRPILVLFGWLVDRKLTEASRTATEAAAWAYENRDDFCAWLAGAVTRERRDELREVFAECSPGKRIG